MRYLFLLALLICGGCKRPSGIFTQRKTASSPPPTSLPANATKIDVSSLLTSEEIQSVTGEPLKEAIPSTRLEAGFAVLQCYFSLATASKSVVITVTNRGSGAEEARDPRQFWMEKFHDAGSEEKEAREEEGRKPAPPEKVDGVGDEAYWLESGSMGALYVLQRNSFIRVAIGGSDDKETKVAKSKQLAQFALKRLPR